MVGLRSTTALFFVATVILALLAACTENSANEAREARVALADMGLEYSPAEFFDRVAASDIVAVELFLQSKMNPNARNGQGNTPLMVAAATGNTELAKLLLKHGAEPNRGSKNNITPLHLAVRAKKTALAELLVEEGADPNVVNRTNGTPLMLAAATGQIEMLKTLLEQGADLDNAAQNGTTALHVAASTGQTDVVEFLLQKGLKVDVANQSGQTPLHAAIHNGQKKMTGQLIKAGADVMAATKAEGVTPLMLTAKRGWSDIVATLLKKGADPARRSPVAGFGAADFAMKSGHRELAAKLVDQGATLHYDQTLAVADQLFQGVSAMSVQRQRSQTAKLELKRVGKVESIQGLSEKLNRLGVGGRVLYQGDQGEDSVAVVLRKDRKIEGPQKLRVFPVGNQVRVDDARLSVVAEAPSQEDILAQRDEINDTLYELTVTYLKGNVSDFEGNAEELVSSRGSNLKAKDVSVFLAADQLSELGAAGQGVRQITSLIRTVGMCRAYERYEPSKKQWEKAYSDLFEPGELASETEQRRFDQQKSRYCASPEVFESANAPRGLKSCMCGWQTALKKPTEAQREALAKAAYSGEGDSQALKAH